MKTIVFAGGFNVGEKITPKHIKAFQKATKMKADIGMVVNDIDFARKLTYYKEFGKKSVIRLYGNRIKCGTTVPLCKLPDFSKVEEIIDWKMYDNAIRKWKKSKRELNVILNKNIVEPLIAQRLKKYGTTADCCRIFREKQLRNKAGVRLRTKVETRGSWRDVLTKTKMLGVIQTKAEKVPMCGAILLALYEQLANEGYQKVIQLYHADEKPAVENGIRIYKTLHAVFPNDARWKLKFENHFH